MGFRDTTVAPATALQWHWHGIAMAGPAIALASTAMTLPALVLHSDLL